MRISDSTAPVNQNGSILINISDLHRGTFHFPVAKVHLKMNVVDRLQKITKVSSGGPYQIPISVIKPIKTKASICKQSKKKFSFMAVLTLTQNY